MSMKLNPEWKKWNDLQNEGGEGYNPHPKWIQADSSSIPSSATPKSSPRLVRDMRGNYISSIKLMEQLKKDERRLALFPEGNPIIQESVDHARKELGL